MLATDAYGGTGGIAQYLRDLIRAIASHPCTENVTVLPRVIAREVEPLPAGVTHVTRFTANKLRFTSGALRTALEHPRFDWIICGHVNLLPVAAMASAASGAGIILVIYGIEAWEPRRRLARSFLSRVVAVISISSITSNRFQRWARLPANRMFLLPNAVDLSLYTPGAKSEELISRWSLRGRRVLLTVGRMDASEQAKGFDEIIDILPGLVSELPEVTYIALGDGSDRERLQTKARTLGMQEHCVFPGYVTESEKIDYYRLADVFVMPSRLEGFGYVFLEALAVGVPVIASKLDGSREAVRNGKWGALVDPDKPEELRAAIRSALTSPNVPDRAELEFFSRDRFAGRCHAILDSLGVTTPQ